MWRQVLYIAFEGDVSAIQWCKFCVSLSGSLLNILQLFASFSENPKLLQWRTVLTTLAICRVMFLTVYLIILRTNLTVMLTIGTMSICFE